MENDIWLWPTRIGALLGIAAFAFRAWEFYRDRRPMLRVVYSTVGSIDDDYVLIVNSSKVATSIYDYSIDMLPNTRLNRLWPRFGMNSVVTRSHGPINVEVPAHGQTTLHLEEGLQDGLPLGERTVRVARTGDLHLRLWKRATNIIRTAAQDGY